MKMLFSAAFSGGGGKSGDIVLANWKGRHYLRGRVIPANPQTTAQTAQRTAFARCVACFQPLVAAIKTYLDVLGADEQLSGFNKMMKASVADERATYGHIIMPNNRYLNPIVNLAAATGTATGEIDLTWDTAGWSADDIPTVFTREIDGAGPTYQTPWVPFTIGAETMATGALTIDSLTATKSHQCAVFPEDQSEGLYGGGLFDDAISQT